MSLPPSNPSRPRAVRAVARPLPAVPAWLVGAVLLVVVAVTALVRTGPALATPPRVHAPTAVERRIGAAVLHVLNQERAAHRLRPLHASTDLFRSARHHDIAMMKANTLSHQVRGERPLGTRVRRAGYHWTWVGENIAWNSLMTRAGAVMLERMMYHEKPPNDPHRENILSRHYRDIGVAVYLDVRHHKLWLTEDFGHH